MDLGTGAPEVVGEVVDYSSIASGTLKGLAIVFGITERGEPGVAKLCQSTQDYRKYFGGKIAGTQFPYLAQDALGRGGRFYIIPVGHYTDPTDKNTLEGTKATATLTGADSDAGDSAAFEATSVGPWANDNLVITSAVAGNGDTSTVDLKVELAGYSELTINIKNVAKQPTAQQIDQLNAKLKNFCKLTAVTNAIPTAVATFATGARDVEDIVTADYVGAPSAGTGIYAADTIRDAVRISVPEISEGALDGKLAEYCDSRKDILTVPHTPLDIDADTIIDYREGQGIYNHVAVNSFRAIMYTGGLVTIDPDTELEVEHSEVMSLLVNYSRKDTTKSSNFAVAGLKRGVIENAKRVLRDFGAASNKTDYDRIYQRGVNAVMIDYDNELGNVVKIDGNRTMWKQNQLVQKANIAEYLVWLYKMMYPIVKRDGQYDPNDPTMWSALYQEIKPILKKSKEEMRAVYDWAYVGDQFANSVSDAKFNNLDDLNNGIYKFRVLVKPIAAAEWIGFEIGVVNASVDFKDFSGANPTA